MSTARVQTSAKLLQDYRERARVAEDELARDIRTALAEGVSATQIAEAAGITRARVYQIRDGRR